VTPPSHTFDARTLAEIRSHARQTYPDECCGVVVEVAGAGETVIRLRNVQDEMHARDPARFPRTARIAYTPHAGEFKRAHELWERARNRLVAFYHSHPEHGAYFSDEDIAQATPFGEPSYPEAIQIVVSVYDREVKDVKAFGWSDGGGEYVEIPLNTR
jgi:proteasome lid subunit RPN8/RPN11